MSSADDESFEALLKPLQDITSKVWDIALTKALENYLVQINNGAKAYVNFTEAAVLVQNSASFYCKRVDSVHLGCQQFVEKLMDTDKENCDTDGQVIKRKRTPKNHVNDEFEPLGPFVSESNINVNLDTIDKHAEKKKVILNKYPKIMRKPNTSCPVYQTKGTEMGFKEEFRLNWRISSNGVLHEDFIAYKIPMQLTWDKLPDEILEVARNSFIQLENTFQMDIDEDGPIITNLDEAAPPSPFRGPSPEPHDSPATQLVPAPPENIKLAEKHTVKDMYKEHTFNFVTPPKEFFKRKYFNLPNELIEEIKDWKLQKIENKENARKSVYTFSSFFNFLKHHILLKCPNSKQEKIMKSKKQKKREILMRLKLYEKAAADAVQECNEDFFGFDPRDDEDSNIQNIDLKMKEDFDISQVEVEGFTQERDDIMMAAKDFKRRGTAEQTEVARRVQAWHESLVDVLDNAEARAHFDIHNYGSMIIEHFKEPPEMKPVIQFAQIVRGQPKHEISRYLLSSLMLANTYNVELIRDPGILVQDCLSLKLLSTVRHHEEMDENLRSNTHC